MASILIFLVFWATFGCTVQVAKGEDEWVLHLNHFMLYEMTKERINIQNAADRAKSVLEAVCEQNNINADYIDSTRIANNLQKAISLIMGKAKKAIRRGGRQGKEVIDNMKSAMYKMKLGGYKRKLEHELESEKKKRRIADEQRRDQKKLVAQFKKRAREAYVAVGRIMKTRVGPKRKVSPKLSYSKSWKKLRKRHMREVMGGVTAFLKSEGMTTNKIDISDNAAGISIRHGATREPDDKIAIDKALYKKDKNGTCDRAYQDFAMEQGSGYPSLYSVQKLQKELNSMFHINHLPGNEGVYESLEEKVVRVLENLPDFDSDTIRIKISGDGTCMGKRIHVTNYAFTMFTDDWKSDDLILAITNTPEKYEYVCRALAQTRADITKMQQEGLTVKGKPIQVDFVFCADLKFTNEILGLNACSSSYSCAWCTCPSIKFSLVDLDFQSRSIADMNVLSDKKKSQKHEPFGCIRKPIFQSIPISHYVPDPLHLYLRISDQLIRKLIQDLQTNDKLAKNAKNVDVDKCLSLSKFQSFIQELGILWRFDTNKQSGIMEYRDFTGPEHRKIQAAINLSGLMPWHPKLQQIEQLWCDFSVLMTRMKQSMTTEETREFKCDAKNWVTLYASTYLAKDVTIYMHIFAKHVDNSIRIHGNISLLSQQSFEKLNDVITKWFFQSTNHHIQNLSALEQIIYKQNRIEYLEPTCRKHQRYRVTCAVCGEQDHNRRTCPDR